MKNDEISTSSFNFQTLPVKILLFKPYMTIPEPEGKRAHTKNWMRFSYKAHANGLYWTQRQKLSHAFLGSSFFAFTLAASFQVSPWKQRTSLPSFPSPEGLGLWSPKCPHARFQLLTHPKSEQELGVILWLPHFGLLLRGLAIPHPPTCLNLSLAQPWPTRLSLNREFAHKCFDIS